MVAETNHRPWPMPDRAWSLAMNWDDLLFMHWPVPAELLRLLIPSTLEIDLFEGEAWLGVVPFLMTGVRPRFFPELFASQFPELNVRTYVKSGGKPGVWFFSLDAANWTAVKVARRLYHLPYQHAVMSDSNVNGTVHYHSRRKVRRATPGADFAGHYKPAGPVFHSEKGSLEHFLTERYCLFSADKNGTVYCGEIHHHRWPLQSAEADIQTNTMTAPLGFKIPETKPHLLFAKRLEVAAWSLTACA